MAYSSSYCGKNLQVYKGGEKCDAADLHFSELIAEGSACAIMPGEKILDAYYLFKATSKPSELKNGETDDYGM